MEPRLRRTSPRLPREEVCRRIPTESERRVVMYGLSWIVSIVNQFYVLRSVPARKCSVAILALIVVVDEEFENNNYATISIYARVR